GTRRAAGDRRGSARRTAPARTPAARGRGRRRPPARSRRTAPRRRSSSDGERAPEPQARDVAPQIAAQATAAESGEQPLLVVHLVAGEEPVATLARDLGDQLGRPSRTAGAK